MITLQLQFSSKYHINNLAVQTIWQAIVFEITVGDRRLPVKCIKCPDIFLQILMKTSGQNCALVINELLIVYQQSQLFYYFSNPWRYHAETNVERIMLKLYFSFHHLFPPFFFFSAHWQACFHGRQKLALLHNHSISQAFKKISEKMPCMSF